MTGRVLIRGGCVLTLGAKTPNFNEADVLIDDGRVAEVGPRLRARDAEVVDATDTIVMPGFVDTHRHVWKSLFRNFAESSPIGDDPVSAAISGRHHQPDDVYAATLIGLLGAVEAGITTVVDWSDIQVDDRFTEASLQAHIDSGTRTVFVHAVPHWAGSHDRDPSTVRRLVAGGAGSTASTTIAAGPDEPARGDLDRIAADWAIARELGLRIHAHAGSERSNQGAVSDLGRRGLLGRDVTLIHCTNLDDADLDAIASSGTSVSLTPSSEMAGGLGSPPIQALIDRGIGPGLGVDDERVAPGDMFAQMRATISLQHANSFDLKLAGKAGLPRLLTTRQVIRYATVDGARVAGLGEVTGALEPGKQADIVVLRTDRPNIAPVNDPIGAVVWGMDTSNIDWVFVAGHALMRHGSLEADVDRARKLASEALRRVTSSGVVAAGREGSG
jgi:cytosine/adenosine deaminase-related metal-dependent hydrolase